MENFRFLSHNQQLNRGREPRAPIKCRALQRNGNLNCWPVKKIMDFKNRALNVEQIEMLHLSPL